MSLRIWLLLLSLVALALPWAGCQYARKMEGVLRSGQEEALLTTAQTLAHVIAADPALPSPENNEYKHYAVQLIAQPSLDGFADEWPIANRALPQRLENRRDHGLRFGLHQGALHVFLSVRDTQVQPENPVFTESKPVLVPDRVVVLMDSGESLSNGDSPAETLRAWSVSAVAPGPIIAHRASSTPLWLPQPGVDADIRGHWRASTDGYDIELRIPQKLIGKKLAIFSVDNAATTYDAVTLAPLAQSSPPLHDRIAQYTPAGTRIAIVDAQGWLLASAGSVDKTSAEYSIDADANQPINWHRVFLRPTEATAPSYGLPYGMWGEPIDTARRGQRAATWFREAGDLPSIVRAAAPIVRDGRIVGAIAVEQAAAQLLRQRDAAVKELLNFLLPVTGLAMAMSLAFGLWLSWRIRRLSKAASSALSPDGHIEHRLPDTHVRDELGDLSRSYAMLLQRLQDYTHYLQTLGSKLTHEIRTPLAIVASSLENLIAEPRGDNARQYIERARDGTKRLQTTLNAMSEATRVEQSIEQAERTQFDLAALMRGVSQAYRQTFTRHRIVAQIPESECAMTGAPDLIAQMLDKLMDNAADFCPPGGRIDIELHTEPKLYKLIVRNEGPLLPGELADKLFDAMVGSRPGDRTGDSQRPHLGLGLYIVQLIVRFHRGRVRAANLDDRRGVEFQIELPR